MQRARLPVRSAVLQAHTFLLKILYDLNDIVTMPQGGDQHGYFLPDFGATYSRSPNSYTALTHLPGSLRSQLLL